MVVFVAGFAEGHKLAPRELDVAGFGFKGEPCFGKRASRHRVNSVGRDHFVDVTVGVETNRVVGQGKRVAVTCAG